MSSGRGARPAATGPARARRRPRRALAGRGAAAPPRGAPAPGPSPGAPRPRRSGWRRRRPRGAARGRTPPRRPATRRRPSRVSAASGHRHRLVRPWGRRAWRRASWGSRANPGQSSLASRTIRPRMGSTTGRRIPAPAPSMPAAAHPTRWPIRPASCSRSNWSMPWRSGVGSASASGAITRAGTRRPGRAQSGPRPGAAGRGRRVGGDDARAAPAARRGGPGCRGRGPPLGGAVAVGDDQRDHLGPEEDPAAQLGEGHRVEAAVADGSDAGVPHDPADHGEPGEEQHVADALPRRDPARRCAGPRSPPGGRAARRGSAAGSRPPALRASPPGATARRAASHGGARRARARSPSTTDAELLEGRVDLAEERRRDDAGADLVQRLAQLGRDRDGQRLVVGHGVRQDGPDGVLGCDRSRLAPPVAPWRQSGPRGFARATVGPPRRGAHYEPCHLGMARGGRCSP